MILGLGSLNNATDIWFDQIKLTPLSSRAMLSIYVQNSIVYLPVKETGTEEKLKSPK